MVDDNLLEIRGLRTYFDVRGQVAKAVDNVDLTIARGQTLGLVGESGCGKSVTAHSIMQLVPRPPGRIEGGTIRFEGRDILTLSEAQMRKIRGNRISMIFQEPMTSLNPVFPVGDQVGEVVRLHQRLSRHDTRARVLEMFHLVGIPEAEARLDNYPHQMSGGMRQRVMIAMALACNPHLMIADEPTTALDVTIQAQILDLMNKLKDETGASILFITHDLGVIAEMAQHVAVMYAGKVVEYADDFHRAEASLHGGSAGVDTGDRARNRGRRAENHQGHGALPLQPARGVPVQRPLPRRVRRMPPHTPGDVCGG